MDELMKYYKQLNIKHKKQLTKILMITIRNKKKNKMKNQNKEQSTRNLKLKKKLI